MVKLRLSFLHFPGLSCLEKAFPFLSFFLKIFVGIMIWQGLVTLIKLPPYFLPSPFQVAKATYQHSLILLTHGLRTFLQILGGLLISTALGGGVAFLLDRYHQLQKWIQPALVILQAIPAFVLIPLLMIWCGFGLLPKMIVVCLSAFFPIALCLLNQLKQIPTEWLELATVMGGSPWQITRVVRWPAALPGLFAGLRLAATYTPLTVLAADWNGASEGLGYLVMLSHGRLQIDLMFACLFLTVSLTLGLNSFLGWLERKYIFWLPRLN